MSSGFARLDASRFMHGFVNLSPLGITMPGFVRIFGLKRTKWLSNAPCRSSKPDAVAKNVIGQIISRFEGAGPEGRCRQAGAVVALKLKLSTLCTLPVLFFKDLVSFMISGPVFVQVLEGEGAILKNRDLMGATDPKKAERAPSAPTSLTASTLTPFTALTLLKPPLWKSLSSSQPERLQPLIHHDHGQPA